MTDTYRPSLSKRSVIASLGAFALMLGLLASYAPGAQAQRPSQGVGTDGSASAAQVNSPINLDRHAGPTRYETSAEIATDAYDASTDVVIASGEDFADALSGAALEGMLDAPVLLVPSDLVNGAVPTATTDAIDDLGATNATILGGDNAVSSDVEDYIESNSTVQTTERVAGSTRFETAEQIAGEVGDAGAIPQGVADAYEGLSEGDNAAFLATGLNWPDAMAGSAGSFAGQHPILLTTPDELHPAAEGGLAAANTDVVFILGGTGVVSSGVASELENDYEVVRLSGADRWETARNIADTFADDWGFGVENVGLATGFAFADALASAPFLGNPAPLVLTPSNETHTTTTDFFTSRGCDIDTIDIFGGDAAVEPSVGEAYAEAACEGAPDVEQGIDGTVTDADSGDPIEDAEVTISNSETTTVSTDADGDYGAELDPGTYDVSVEADGYDSASETDVEVTEGAATTVDFELDAVPEVAQLEDAGLNDNDNSGDLSDGDELTLNFGSEVELESTVTLEGDNGEQIVLTDEGADGSADPEEVDATFSLSGDGLTVTITLNETPDTDLTNPITVVGCTGINDAETGDPVDCAAADVSFSIDEPEGNQAFSVTPGDEAINTVSATTGADEDRGLREYTAEVGDEPVSIALLPADNVTDESGVVTFADGAAGTAGDGRADDIRGTDAVIESVNGVSVSDDDGYESDVTSSGGAVTFSIDTVEPNTNVVPVVFEDGDNDDQLDLDEDDAPTENFGIGGAKLWIPEEAPFGLNDTGRIQLIRGDIEDPFLTIETTGGDDYTLFYTESSILQYSSGQPQALISIGEFEDWASGPGEDSIGAVPGDELNFSYNSDSANTTLSLTDDTPMMVGSLTGMASDTDFDGTQDDAELDWEAPSNPDVVGYNVYRVTQNSDGSFPDFGSPINVPGNTFTADGADATSFNDQGLAPDTYRYAVVAINGESGQRSLLDMVDVEIVDETVEPAPFSVDTSFTDGDGASDDELDGADPGDAGDDQVTFFFDTESALNVDPDATMDLRGEDGQLITLTNGSNATMTVAGPDDDELTVTFTEPTYTPVADPFAGGPIREDDVVEVTDTSGISSEGGEWNLARSGCNDIYPSNCGVVNERAFTEGNPFAINDSLPQSQDADFIEVDGVAGELTVLQGADTNGQGIEDGEDFAVYEETTGELVAEGTFDATDTPGTTVAADIEPGDRLLFVYEDTENDFEAGNRQVSNSTLLSVDNEIPEVLSVQRTNVAEDDMIDVLWDEEVTLTGDPDDFVVYDSTNSNVVATGEGVSEKTSDSFTVDLNSDLTVNANPSGPDYVLRIQSNSAQDSDNNPNPSQAVPFEFTSPDLDGPVVDNMSHSAGDGSFEITFDPQGGDLDPASVDDDDFIYSGGSIDSTSVSGDTVTVNVSPNLSPGDTVGVSADEVADDEGNTGPPSNETEVVAAGTGPAVSSSTQDENATEFTIVFDESLDPASVDDSDFFYNAGTVDDTTVSSGTNTDDTVTVDVSKQLEVGETIGVDADSVTDPSGNPGPASTYTETVPDNAGPIMTGSTIDDNDGDSDITSGDEITLTFDQAMDQSGPGAIDITVSDGDGDSDVLSDATPPASNITWSWSSATELEGTLTADTSDGSGDPVDLAATLSDATTGGTDLEDPAGNAWDDSQGDRTLDDTSGPLALTTEYQDANSNLAIEDGESIVITYNEVVQCGIGDTFSAEDGPGLEQTTFEVGVNNPNTTMVDCGGSGTDTLTFLLDQSPVDSSGSGISLTSDDTAGGAALTVNPSSGINDTSAATNGWDPTDSNQDRHIDPTGGTDVN